MRVASAPARLRGSVESFNYRILNRPLLVTCGEHLEQFESVTEESRIKKKFGSRIRALAKDVHFNYSEIEALLLIYHKFARLNHSNMMTKTQLQDIMHSAFEMTDMYFNNNVVAAWDPQGQDVRFENWVKGLSICMRGKLEEQIDFCFRCYDKYGYGKLSRDTAANFFSTALIGETDDAARDLMELVMVKLDRDKDGLISKEEFTEVCMEDPLWMQCFGQCMPTRLAVFTFVTGFSIYSGKHY